MPILNLKENCCNLPIIRGQVVSLCFWQRIGLTKSGTSKFFKININLKKTQEETGRQSDIAYGNQHSPEKKKQNLLSDKSELQSLTATRYDVKFQTSHIQFSHL